MKREMVSPSLLRKLLSYDSDTGRLTWKSRDACMFCGNDAVPKSKTWNTRFAGRAALATQDRNGYFYGSIFGMPYAAHRVIWGLKTGLWPVEVDHIDGNPRNNVWENLRNATRSQNMKNQKIRTDNTSGVVGVSKRGNSWRAYITSEGRRIGLGTFDCIWTAVEARREAEKTYGFHENHGRQA